MRGGNSSEHGSGNGPREAFDGEMKALDGPKNWHLVGRAIVTGRRDEGIGWGDEDAGTVQKKELVGGGNSFEHGRQLSRIEERGIWWGRRFFAEDTFI